MGSTGSVGARFRCEWHTGSSRLHYPSSLVQDQIDLLLRTIALNPKPIALALIAALPNAAASETACSLLTHAKLSLADFAESPLDTDAFYFEDASNLVREGTLRISGRTFEVSFEDFYTVYECQGSRNDPCIKYDQDAGFLYEARVDFSMNVVIEIERKTNDDLNVFARGGVADSGFRIWKIVDCK